MRTDRRPRRRAYLLIETAMAGLLIALAMTMTVRLLAWVASERRSAERRGWAAQEAANAMERLAALPFDRLDPSAAKAAARLSPAASGLLPGGRVAVEVADDAGLKRIDVEVRWWLSEGIDDAPVRITSWVANKEAAR